MMEDEVGGGRPTTAADLVGLLTAVPRLLFVSACLTATGADASGHLPPGDGHKGEPGPGGGGLVAHSLATALVAAGVPAVIGWDGSVGDRAATAVRRAAVPGAGGPGRGGGGGRGCPPGAAGIAGPGGAGGLASGPAVAGTQPAAARWWPGPGNGRW